MNDNYSRLGAGGMRARKLFLVIDAHARRLFARHVAPVSSAPTQRGGVAALDAKPADAVDGLTVVQPALAVSSRDEGRMNQEDGASRAAWDDATVVKLASRLADRADSAEVRSNDVNDSHASDSSVGDSRSTDSSLNRDTWQRVARAQSSDHASVGKLLKGRFLLERELGRGGMGVV